ncbi:MAG: hypothetical protein HC851_17075 [Acaryochloris sp. RU_4_1]|nr:hypothetical protein [Acaryochloris sp. RU_4_1]NJR56201.1 hypothetical protein [Acaryochloris sp. CRU_2_0]
MNDPEDPDPENIKNAVPAPPEAIPAVIDTLQLSDKSSRQAFSLLKYQDSFLHLQPTLLASSFTSKSNVVSALLQKKVPNLLLLPMKDSVAQLRTVIFDRVGTQQYAAKWWNSYNPKYQNFEKVLGFINRGDCTNYASQILYEGGKWAMVGDVEDRKSDSAWWYNFNDPVSSQTYTWAAAVNFWRFLNTHPNRATPVNRSSLLSVGDIVQVDFGEGEGLSHTMVVTSRRSDDGMI